MKSLLGGQVWETDRLQGAFAGMPVYDPSQNDYGRGNSRQRQVPPSQLSTSAYESVLSSKPSYSAKDNGRRQDSAKSYDDGYTSAPKAPKPYYSEENAYALAPKPYYTDDTGSDTMDRKENIRRQTTYAPDMSAYSNYAPAASAKPQTRDTCPWSSDLSSSSKNGSTKAYYPDTCPWSLAPPSAQHSTRPSILKSAGASSVGTTSGAFYPKSSSSEWASGWTTSSAPSTTTNSGCVHICVCVCVCVCVCLWERFQGQQDRGENDQSCSWPDTIHGTETYLPPMFDI
jgi:hypothetical protein